jgi:ribosomal protein L11 methyltransferase
MGFGTGHHQTTRLCLAALQDLELEARTVLDIGTGSGVLAIAAIALGAARAIGIDTDADALQAADENVVLNGMSERVRLRVADFRTPAFPDLGDIVTANLTGPMLATSAQELIACTVPGGTLVLSGFVVAERDIVLGAFAEATRFARESAEDEWAAAVLEMA